MCLCGEKLNSHYCFLLNTYIYSMSEVTKKYTNGEITIVWKPGMCIHSTKCWKGEEGLAAVFNPRERPWIKPEGAGSSAIIEQIKKCPSGALSYYHNDKGESSPEITESHIVEVLKNGPLLVYGNITVKDKDGNQASKSNVTAFCRCGQSANKPYCDGTHVKSGFLD